MSSLQPSAPNRKFLALASLIIVLTAGLAASAWPAVSAYCREQSASLSAAGKRAGGDEAQMDFRLAYLLDSHNQAAATAVADEQLTAGRPQAALATLIGAGEGREADRVRLKVALEAGNTPLAVTAADRLSGAGYTQTDAVLAALAYGVAGKRERIEDLKASVSSPQALQRVLRAGGSKVTLALELRATGLQISSRGVLEGAEVSVPRNLLLASLIGADGRTDDLPTLAKLYQEAITLDPSSIAARSGLIAVLRAQKDTAGVDAQQVLLGRLQNGRP